MPFKGGSLPLGERKTCLQVAFLMGLPVKSAVSYTHLDVYKRQVVAALTTAIKKRFLPSHIILGRNFGLDEPSMVMLE